MYLFNDCTYLPFKTILSCQFYNDNTQDNKEIVKLMDSVVNKAKIFISFLFKDFRVVKLCFMALTSYLLYEELYVFLITKPTLTSVTQTSISTEQFPDVLICPEQAFELNLLNKLGYTRSLYYGLGQADDSKLIGWLGNQTEFNITEIVNQISRIKTLKDCPEVIAKFKINGSLKDVPLSLNLTRVKYPNGRCCRVVKPREANEHVLFHIRYHTYIKNFTKFTKGFHMFLSDQKSSSFFLAQKFAMEGPKLTSNPKKLGWITYKIKVLEDIHIAEDPNFQCKNYYHNGDYNRCLEEEYTRQSLDILNCTPPWMTDYKDIWCKHHLNTSDEIRDRTRFLLGK